MIKSPEAKERKRIRERERRKRLNADHEWRAKEIARMKKSFEKWKANHPTEYKAGRRNGETRIRANVAPWYISGDWSAMSYTAIIQKPMRSIGRENENIVKQGEVININRVLQRAFPTGLVKGKT